MPNKRELAVRRVLTQCEFGCVREWHRDWVLMRNRVRKRIRIRIRIGLGPLC